MVNTTHPDNPMFEGSKTPSGDFSSTLAEDVRATCRTIDFQKLEVLEKEEATPLESAIKIRVSFKVIGQKGYSQKGKEVQSFLELARFVRNDADSRWLYIGGEYL